MPPGTPPTSRRRPVCIAAARSEDESNLRTYTAAYQPAEWVDQPAPAAPCPAAPAAGQTLGVYADIRFAPRLPAVVAGIAAIAIIGALIYQRVQAVENTSEANAEIETVAAPDVPAQAALVGQASGRASKRANSAAALKTPALRLEIRTSELCWVSAAADGERAFLEWLREPVASWNGATVNRYLLEAYLNRPDVQSAYPSLEREGVERVVDWGWVSGPSEMGMSKALLPSPTPAAAALSTPRGSPIADRRSRAARRVGDWADVLTRGRIRRFAPRRLERLGEISSSAARRPSRSTAGNMPPRQ